MTRRLPWLLLLACVCAGCARRSRVETAARDQVLLVGNGAEAKDLDPQTFETSNEYHIESSLFEGLVDLANDGRTILPGVAEHWEVSADGRVYTFRLRADASWSDGTPITSADFLYSYRRYFEPTLANVNAVYCFAIAGSRDYAAGKTKSPETLGLRAPDPHTFEISLEYRQPYFLSILATMYPVPPAVVERFGGGKREGTAWTRPGNLVSNGPFVLQSWQPNRELIVRKNPRYWDREPVLLREIHFLPLDNLAAEERAFRSGELHVTYSLPAAKLPAYRGKPELHVSPELHTDYLVFQTARKPFDDPRVRRAFSRAIDRDNLIPRVLHETASPAHSLTRPGSGGYTPSLARDFDPAEARRLLAAAGFPGGRGFPAVEFTAYSDPNRELGEALQQIWRRELGVRIGLASVEKKTFFDRLSSGDYSAAIMGYFYAVDAAEAMLLMPLSDSNYNYARWRSPAYDRAYLAATSARTEAERTSALDRMERLVQAEAPYAPLYFVDKCFLVSPLLRGWRDNPLGAIDWRELFLQP